MERQVQKLELGVAPLKIVEEDPDVKASILSPVIDGEDPKSYHVITQRLLYLQQKREERERDETRGVNEYGWGVLPDLIIEQIFSYLNMSEKYTAHRVCRQWSRAFYMPKSWHTFILKDTTLTRRRFNYYEGWQYRLDNLRMQQFVQQVGNLIKKLVLSPMWDIYNLYQFMHLISCYSEKYREDPTSTWGCEFKIRTLRFDFWCQQGRDEENVYGTGGELLECLKRLMSNLKYLTRLELLDLNLDHKEAEHLLDETCSDLCEQLKYLTLINATKTQFGILHPICFINLRILKISPQNLNEEVVEMLANNERFKELHLVQSTHTDCPIKPVDCRVWRRVANRYQVFLRTYGKVDREVVWQDEAPVASIIYDCPLTKFSWFSTLTVVQFYSLTLREYGHLGLPKFRSSRKFVNRIDIGLLGLCRRCTNIETLYVRDRISTSTALLIVSMSPNLKNFYVRRNALLKKCDYMFHHLPVDFNFIQWIKLNAKSYEKTTNEIAKILGYAWKPLSDKEFKIVCQNKPAY